MEKFMETNPEKFKTLGSIGGAGSSAVAGGFNAGPMIAAQGGSRGDSSPQFVGAPKSGGDARMGGHFGPTTGAANAGSGYNQGDQFAAGIGKGSAVGLGGVSRGGDSRNDGDCAPAAAGTGYSQGDQFAAKVK
jgi:hypothetical protein